MTMRILIVDDEPPARDRLKRLLKDEADVVIVGEASDGLSALALVDEHAPDVVLLDVQMPELDGLGVASAIDKEDGPKIIFTTAHDEHALKAFDLAAVDYLLKPIAKDRLRSALERARNARVNERERGVGSGSGGVPAVDLSRLPRTRKMAVKCGAKYVVFDTNRVTAVLAQDHYAAIFVEGRELLSDDSLDAIMTRLDPAMFMRVHRSAIVNIELVKELEQEGERKYVAILSDNTRAPIARERLDDVKKRLGVG
jgi:two-component system, LytTR family, response regulator